MICELVKAGKTVGITAQSHAVIANVLAGVVDTNAKKYNLDLEPIRQKPSSAGHETLDGVKELPSKAIAEETNYKVVGGTAWLWSRADMKDKVDVLFVDEGGQFSLADATAVSHSANSMVILGDPQQLENVTQGVHPPEIEVSVLGYLLGTDKVVDRSRGLFLDRTFRMNPTITEFISETFYENKLGSAESLERQTITGKTSINGNGIRLIMCPHEGNQSKSVEEVDVIKKLVKDLIDNGNWTDKNEKTHKLLEQDILIVAPYNSQVNELKRALPELRIGTVDKFQGRQAPVVIYSMTTSSPDDAPRGMEFLYSLNRLNVAISRAQCLAIMVASPKLFELDCKTPHQMRLANAFCRYLELSQR